MINTNPAKEQFAKSLQEVREDIIRERKLYEEKASGKLGFFKKKATARNELASKNAQLLELVELKLDQLEIIFDLQARFSALFTSYERIKKELFLLLTKGLNYANDSGAYDLLQVGIAIESLNKSMAISKETTLKDLRAVEAGLTLKSIELIKEISRKKKLGVITLSFEKEFKYLATFEDNFISHVDVVDKVIKSFFIAQEAIYALNQGALIKTEVTFSIDTTAFYVEIITSKLDTIKNNFSKIPKT